MISPDLHDIDFSDPDSVFAWVDEIGPHAWPNVAHLADELVARLWNIETRIGLDSPINSVNAAIAAAAAESAFAAVALSLGVEVNALRATVADWYESFDNGQQPPPPMSPREFIRELRWQAQQSA